MRIVVKVGTSTLAHATGRLNIKRIEQLCKILADLKTLEDKGVIIVDWGKIVKDCIDAGKIDGGSMLCDQNSYSWDF